MAIVARLLPVDVSRQERLAVIGAVLLAVVARIAVLIYSFHSYKPVYDAADFNRIAISLAQGHGFGKSSIPGVIGPSAFRTPLYPGLLAVVYFVFGVHVEIARAFEQLLSVAAAVSVGALGWTLGGKRVGIVTLYLAAIYPPLLLAGYGLNYEPLFVTLTCCSLVAAVAWSRQPDRLWLLALTGILIGLTTLCRETGLLLLVPAAILIVTRRSAIQPRRLLAGGLLVLAGTVIVVGPWTTRNAIRMHSFVLVSDSPQVALAGTYNATAAHDGSKLARWIFPTQDPTDLRKIQALGRHPTEADFSAAMQWAALAYLRGHPGMVGRVVVGNTVRLFALRGFSDAVYIAPYIGWSTTLTKLSVLAFWIVAPFAVAGLFTTRGRQTPWAIWTFPLVLYMVLALTVGIIQYRIGLEPFFLVAAAMLLEPALVRGPIRRTPRPLADESVHVVAEQ